MVVINTAVNILFKIPISVNPSLNLYLQFYWKNKTLAFEKPGFKEFYMWLIYSGSFMMIEDFLDFMYCLSISIQFFIYRRFDTKFRNGFDILFKVYKDKTKKNFKK